jgi:Uncharacterized Zn-finger containing protein
MGKVEKADIAKRMAELLKAGNIMLSDSCPDCKVPLFKLRDGKIICPSCNRTVIYVKHGEENVVKRYQAIEEMLSTITDKLAELNLSISSEDDIIKLNDKVKVLNSLLDAYDKLIKLRKEKD